MQKEEEKPKRLFSIRVGRFEADIVDLQRDCINGYSIPGEKPVLGYFLMTDIIHAVKPILEGLKKKDDAMEELDKNDNNSLSRVIGWNRGYKSGYRDAIIHASSILKREVDKEDLCTTK